MTANSNETQALAYGATSPDSGVGPLPIERRELRSNDVAIDISYCGICHTDLHFARNDWGATVYPVVPGHEIVGVVREVGAAVTKHKAGDNVAVGCMVDSCSDCGPCDAGLEQFCAKGSTGTYNGKDRHSGDPTYGGYSSSVVVRDEFALKLSDSLDLSRIAPALCAGITTWSPLKNWNVGPGTSVAVAGLGGLGHMGVKLAVALGAEVTVITRSPDKAEAARALGAHDVVVSTDRAQMKQARGRFDFILDTIPVSHDLAPALGLLAMDGTIVIVGMVDMIPSFHTGLLMGGRKRVSGSPIGGIAETQEMLDFCALHNIHPDTELIGVDDINNAYERMEKSDVKYRFVIDMSTLKS